MNMMNTEKNKDERNARCGDYLVRGALLWGPIYTAGVSGIVYLTSSTILSYMDVLLNSLVICPVFGVMSGYLRWRVAAGKPDLATNGKAAKGRSTTHRFKAYLRAVHKKAA